MATTPRVHAPMPIGALNATRGTSDVRLGTAQLTDVVADARTKAAPLG